MSVAIADNVIEPNIFTRLREAKNPYKTAKAAAAQDDARKRLPEEYAHRAIAAIGHAAPNHNILTLAHAYVYADAGLYVIDAHALDRSGKGTGPGEQCKVPRGAQWQARATTDPDALGKFWAGEGEYPEDKHGNIRDYARPEVFRNVSIAFPKGCGLFVLDIDGEAGLDALEALEKEHGALPQTWESITGSGGVHLIFRAENLDIRNTASSIASGVDIRGANGQIIAPPSVHPSGEFYRWEDGCAPWECEVADAPEWICKLAYEATKGRNEDAPKRKKAGKQSKKKRAASAATANQSSDVQGLEAHLASIGDGDGLKGFNSPINSACCAFFAKEGVDADPSGFVEILRQAILDAPCENGRAKSRYATDEHLEEAIADARAYIEEQDTEAEQEEVYSPTTAEIDAFIEEAGIDKDSSQKEIHDFIEAHLAADAAARERFTNALGSTSRKSGASVLKPKEIEGIWKKLDREAAKIVINEDAEARRNLPQPDYVPLEEATKRSVERAASAASWLPIGWTCRDGWFGFFDPEKKDQNGDPIFKPVCLAFEVVSFADGVTGSTRTNQITIRYVHRSSHLGVVESDYRIGDTYSGEGSVLRRLANEGLGFHPMATAEQKLTLLRSVSCDRESVFHAHSGWNKDRSVYLSPTGEAVTKSDDKRVHQLDRTMRVSNARSGTVEEFRANAKIALQGRAAQHFVMGFLTGPVGCSANFLGLELSPVVRNEGKARHGKTTALKAGVSWFTIPTIEGLVFSADTTWTALEVLAVKGTGAALAPDDDGTSDNTPEEEQRMALQYAGGVGRVRGTPEGGLRDVRSWTGCMGQSTEHRLDRRLEAAQAKDDAVDIKSGAMSRIVTVNYDSIVTLRRSPPLDQRDEGYKAEDFDDAELDAYGALAHDAKKGGGIYAVAGPVYAKKLLELGFEEVRDRHSALVAEWTGSHSGASMRVVETMALFGVTAEIAQEAGLLPEEDDVGLKSMLKKTLETTIAERSQHLDTSRQALNALRVALLNGVQNGLVQVVGGVAEDWRGVLAYFKSDPRKNEDENESVALNSREYIIPTRNVPKLVKAELSSLVEDLRAIDMLVLPKDKPSQKRGLWRDTPGEGRHESLRIKGAFVHGEWD